MKLSPFISRFMHDQVKITFTMLSLLISILMLFGLFGLVFINGMSVFWPKNIYLFSTTNHDGTPKTFLAEFTALRHQIRHADSAAPSEAMPDKEIRLYTAGRDLFGEAFRYINLSDLVRLEKPRSALKLERSEYGPLLGYPLLLSTKEGDYTYATNEDAQKLFFKALKKELRYQKQLHRHIEKIERVAIGKINKKIESTRLDLESENNEDKRDVLRSRMQSLEDRYSVLAEEVNALREEHRMSHITLNIPQGNTQVEQTLNFEDMLDYQRPNTMHVMEKILSYFKHFYLFLTTYPREANTEGGIFPAIFGTFVMTILMSILVVPFGVLAAVYLREYAKEGLMVRLVRISVNNLAGVPSIVFGVFGLGFFVYFLGHYVDLIFFSNKLPTPTYGTGGVFWASLTLALLTVPVVIVATEEALVAVPRGIREAALACGATKWQVVKNILLPASTPGILTGLILAVARGAGEVAPLMLVGVVKLAPDLPIDTTFPFLHPERKFMHLGFHIYDLGFQSPDSEAALPMVFVTTLLLIVLVVVVNITALILRHSIRKKMLLSPNI